MIAFKTYKDCPNQIKPPNIPDLWVWQEIEIPEDQVASFIDAGYSVLTYAEVIEYKASHQVEFDTWNNGFDQAQQNEKLRVIDLIEPVFANLPTSKIDFRRHLRPEVYLQKNILMLPNGRPQKALYSFNNILIAEIEFIFEVNAFNFMARRTEKLAYYKKSGLLSDKFVIADDVYNMNNPYHLREMMKERSEARSLIIEEVKAFLNGVLAQYYLPQGKTYPEILEIAGEFWDKYSTPIDSWISVGSPQFKTLLTADVDFVFLSTPVAAGVTVRSYILNKTSY